MDPTMRPGALGLLVQEAERTRQDALVFVTTRTRTPRERIALLPGLPALVVGTERHGESLRVIVRVAVVDLRRWLERRGYAHSLTPVAHGPSHAWWLPSAEGGYAYASITAPDGTEIPCCRLCGAIQQATGRPHSPCRGPARIALRSATP